MLRAVLVVALALGAADAAVACGPGWAKGHLRRGEALLAMARPGEALAACDEADRLDPTNDFVAPLRQAASKAGEACPN